MQPVIPFKLGQIPHEEVAVFVRVDGESEPAVELLCSEIVFTDAQADGKTGDLSRGEQLAEERGAHALPLVLRQQFDVDQPDFGLVSPDRPYAGILALEHDDGLLGSGKTRCIISPPGKILAPGKGVALCRIPAGPGQLRGADATVEAEKKTLVRRRGRPEQERLGGFRGGRLHGGLRGIPEPALQLINSQALAVK